MSGNGSAVNVRRAHKLVAVTAESIKALVEDICERSGLPFDRERVIGHDMYNPQKTDPGELFDYDRLFD